jgi:hypothetical protein
VDSCITIHLKATLNQTLDVFSNINRKVKYAYQKMPHSEDTVSPHSQEKERKRESMVYKMTISKQTPQNN